MARRTIKLTNDIKEQVTECVKEAESGPSPSGKWFYTCTSECELECKGRNMNEVNIIDEITKKLASINNKTSCVIEVSVSPVQIQKQEQKPFRKM